MKWLALMLLAGPAQAQEVYLSDDGGAWALDAIEGGAVLVNADDPADEITLSQDCSASHPGHGDGTWAWDTDGLVVTFDDGTLRLDGNIPLDAPECSG